MTERAELVASVLVKKVLRLATFCTTGVMAVQKLDYGVGGLGESLAFFIRT